MQAGKATAVAHANIALVKYWGNIDNTLRLPANSSLSVNLTTLTSTTTVAFEPALKADEVWLDGLTLAAGQRQRVLDHLERVRALAGLRVCARVVSRNSFASGAGLASSASGFAALTLAATAAAGLLLSQPELSALARLGSGSACRSVPGGFVVWHPALRHEDSYGTSMAPPEHWALADVIAIVTGEHKEVGSTPGHALADTSPLQAARVSSTPGRFKACESAVRERDFQRLAPVLEQEALTMHAVMLTCAPPLIYWAPTTLHLMQMVREWRHEGLPVAFTIDAGPNVHCLCPQEAAKEVEARLRATHGVQSVITATPAGPARLVETHLC
jgi:diphosphomevalonate decarboxylase